jgi:hypothetical protein
MGKLERDLLLKEGYSIGQRVRYIVVSGVIRRSLLLGMVKLQAVRTRSCEHPHILLAVEFLMLRASLSCIREGTW